MKTKIFSGLFLLLLLLYGSVRIVPSIFKSDIEKELEGLLGQKVEIEEITLEPLLFWAGVRNIRVGKSIFVKKIFLDVSIIDLFSHKINIEKFHLDEMNFSVLKQKDIYNVLGLEKLNQKKKTDNRDATKEIDSKPWDISLGEIKISDIQIQFQKNHHINFKNIELQGLEVAKESKKADFNLNFNIDESSFKMKGTLGNVLGDIDIDTKISIEKFNLNILNEFTDSKVGRIEGELNFRTDLKFSNSNLSSSFDLEGDKIKIHSLKTKDVDYFVHHLKLDNGKLKKTSDEKVELSFSNFAFQNFILSITNKRLKKKKLSKFSKFDLNDFTLMLNQNREGRTEGDLIRAKLKYNKTGNITVVKTFKGGNDNFSLKINDMDLIPLSEALEPSLGYYIDSGKLDLKYIAKTRNKNIKGDVVVKLNQFNLDDKDELGKAAESKSSLPLSTAISMIRDDDGRIIVNSEVSGKTDNPDFNFGTMLRNGIGGILLAQFSKLVATKAAVQFIPFLVSKIPFSPANMYMITKSGYNLITKPRFEDINFKAKTDQIQSESMKQIKVFAKFLKKNKSLRFKMCPIASSFEKDKLSDDRALELAKLRITKIQSTLKEIKVSDSQVIFCRPKLVTKKLEVGKVEISI